MGVDSTRGTFGVAGPSDDAALRALLRCTPTDGAVQVAFTREPSYFAGEGLAGAADTTLVHRSGETLDGIGRLAVQRLNRNGQLARVGYLGELRLDASTPRRARVLRDGYACLRDIVAAAGVDGCFTSIASDNVRARRVLEHGGRLGIPEYVPLADLVTLFASVRPSRATAPGHATVANRDELTTFLDRHARATQLSLRWNAGMWEALAPHGLSERDFRVVREAGRIVAAGAVWDQRAFRQVVVCGYRGLLRHCRPAIDALSRTRLVPPLPPAGTVLAQGMVVGAAVDAPGHWPALVRELVRDAASRGLDWLAIARDERDPEAAVLARLLRVRQYRTRLYEVRWPGLPTWSGAWNGSHFRPEAALL